jgi:tetratricopeptide (TPR) repeat protein
MSRLRPLGLFLALLFALPVLAAGTPAQIYNSGNALYAAGNYGDAIKAYQEVLNGGTQSADLYYNLGNAYLKAGRLGPAIVAYERALRQRPRDPDLAHNLRYARVQIKGRLPAVERGFWLQVWDQARDSFSLNELVVLLSVGWFLLGGGLAVRILLRQPWLRLAAAIALGAGVGVLVLAGPLFGAKLHKEVLTQPAVILEARTEARSGPGENNAELFQLFEGMKVIVNQCESGYCEVQVPGGLTGWIKAGTFEII